MAPSKIAKGSRGSSGQLDVSESTLTAKISTIAVPVENISKSDIPEFTSTEMLNEETPGDNTLNIVGFVDAILGSQTVGNKRRLSLFKFVLNNNEGSKITVLIWEDQIQLYERSIIYHEILELQNVKALPLDPLFNSKKDGFVNFELSIQRNTKLILHGVFHEISSVRAVVIQTIPIKYAAAYEGSSVVEGYISANFSQVTTGSGSCSYASGAISDGQYKLRVQVANFVRSSITMLGTNVKITGLLKKDKYNSVYLQIEDEMSIVRLSDDKLDNVQLKNCFRAPLKILPSA